MNTKKLVLLGNTAVGKSCLAVRASKKVFYEMQEPTIGGTMTRPTQRSARAAPVSEAPWLPANAFCCAETVWSSGGGGGLRVGRSASALSARRRRVRLGTGARELSAARRRAATRAPLSSARRVAGDVSMSASLCARSLAAAFLAKEVALEDVIVKFEIWDTAGQERYRSLAPMYYRGAAAAIIVYDVSSKETYAGAKTWIKEVQRNGDAGCTIALVGNKADLADTDREVDRDVRWPPGTGRGRKGGQMWWGRTRLVSAWAVQDAREYAKENGVIFFEVSAKTGLNVEELFNVLGASLSLRLSLRLRLRARVRVSRWPAVRPPGQPGPRAHRVAQRGRCLVPRHLPRARWMCRPRRRVAGAAEARIGVVGDRRASQGRSSRPSPGREECATEVS